MNCAFPDHFYAIVTPTTFLSTRTRILELAGMNCCGCRYEHGRPSPLRRVTPCFATFAGMNLRNGGEESITWFRAVAYGTLAAMTTLFCAGTLYFYCNGILVS